MSKLFNKEVIVLLVIGVFGVAWLAINIAFKINYNICLFKNIVGLPCPACGSTKAALLLTKGAFFLSLKTNPLALFTILFWGYFFILYFKDFLLGSSMASLFLSKLKSYYGLGYNRYFFWFLVMGNWIYVIYKSML